MVMEISHTSLLLEVSSFVSCSVLKDVSVTDWRTEGGRGGEERRGEEERRGGEEERRRRTEEEENRGRAEQRKSRGKRGGREGGRRTAQTERGWWVRDSAAASGKPITSVLLQRDMLRFFSLALHDSDLF